MYNYCNKTKFLLLSIHIISLKTLCRYLFLQFQSCFRMSVSPFAIPHKAIVQLTQITVHRLVGQSVECSVTSALHTCADTPLLATHFPAQLTSNTCRTHATSTCYSVAIKMQKSYARVRLTTKLTLVGIHYLLQTENNKTQSRCSQTKAKRDHKWKGRKVVKKS